MLNANNLRRTLKIGDLKLKNLTKIFIYQKSNIKFFQCTIFHIETTFFSVLNTFLFFEIG